MRTKWIFTPPRNRLRAGRRGTPEGERTGQETGVELEMGYE